MKSEDLCISIFSEDRTHDWDTFIIQDSLNGTHLSTRRFLDYHPKDRFVDHSLIISKKQNIVAILPACEINSDNGKSLISHQGSTFSGLIISKKYFNTSNLQGIIETLDNYLINSNIKKIILRQSPSNFVDGTVNSLDFMFSLNGYSNYQELNFVIDLDNTRKEKDILNTFRPNTRNKVRKGISNLECKYIESAEDISVFHSLLAKNLEKHDKSPIHSIDELIDLKKRFPTELQFIHCSLGEEVIAGAMTWYFKKKLIHTQYISTNYKNTEMHPVNFLVYRLIEDAAKDGYRYFSFGISTEDHGKKLNYNLAKFKEGFGAEGYLIKTFSKEFG